MLLYNLLSVPAFLIYLPFLLLKRGPESRLAFLRERLGVSSCKKTDIWVHAVSVGEVIACMPFLKMLKKEFPEKRIVLSTTTYTGQKVARERFPEADRIMYIPLDIWFCVRRAAASLNPRIFITIETELWPALFYALKRKGCRIIILNGRISNRSFKGYKRLSSFMKKVLACVDFLYMQGKSDAERIRSIGADKFKVGVMGNFKFDISFDGSGHPDWLEDVKGRILLAASTHKGEEEIILNAYESIRQDYPDLKLILAPRHPERFSEVEELIRKRGLGYIKRSMMQNTEYRTQSTDEISPNPSFSKRGTINPPFEKGGQGGILADIILLDTIGELSRVFSKADVAFVGGSLVPVGGHNILEPAYWARPIIFGPHMENFPFAEDFLNSSAAVQVGDANEIITTVKDLLKDNDKAARMGQNAKAILENNSGAVKKAIELVRGFIGTA
ncbi:MAG: 3-deoxy-D-manno-octulosonic acid transferase [Nitrospirae bacterium]|nr:3-deoxy-D-manno-octulosonic acid transferase [Nitrospirota bacterium]